MEIKVEIAELQKRKLFVATPMYGGQCAGMFTRSIADLSAICAKYQIPLQLYFLFNESLITRARNYCVDEFMRSGATHLMFIDSDIGFNPQDVLALLAMMTDESEYDVMGGPYPKKCISWEKIKQAVDKGVADKDPNVLEKFVGDYVFNPKGSQKEIPIGAPVEVMEIGTGFMMVRRKTFEDYEKAYPHLHYKPDHVRTEHFDGTREIMAYFDCVIDRGYGYENLHQLLADVAAGKEGLQDIAKKMIDGEQHSSKRYLSEDYMFCYNVERMGARVWFCPWMQLQHVGSYVFGGSLADLASIGASATADVNKLNKPKK
jgi:hypothetical protein